MGKRGPAPTPTPILKLRGSSLATRKRREREIKHPSGVPDMPNWLDDDAKAAWKHLVPQLKAMADPEYARMIRRRSHVC